MATNPALTTPVIAAFDTQRTGRMGEIVVELELLKRGWLVGNFNASTLNAAGFDLFATKGARSVKIRVKAKRPGVECFRWSARADGTIFIANSAGDDDFVAAVSFEADGSQRVYVIPTAELARTLAEENDRWLGGTKRDGTARKATSMRHLYLDHRDDGTPAHGFATRWAHYQDAWKLLG